MKQIKNFIFRWSDDIRSRLFYSLAVMVSDKKIILKTNPSYVVLYQIKKKKLRNPSSDSVTTSDQDFFLCKNSIFSYFSKQIHLMFVLYQIKKKTLRNPSSFSATTSDQDFFYKQNYL